MARCAVSAILRLYKTSQTLLADAAADEASRNIVPLSLWTSHAVVASAERPRYLCGDRISKTSAFACLDRVMNISRFYGSLSDVAYLVAPVVALVGWHSSPSAHHATLAVGVST